MSKPKLPTRVLVTAAVVALALVVAGLLYLRSVRAPWTRDGQVSANIVLITPQVTGKVVEVNVVDNQLVRAGDLLFAIDPRKFQLQVDSARVQLDEARQQVAALEAAVAVAEANVEAARAGITTAAGGIEASIAEVDSAHGMVSAADAGVQSAQAGIVKQQATLEERIRERDRAIQLAKEGAGSVANAEGKTASVQAAEAQLDSVKAGLLSAEASRYQANAGLAQAQANLIVSRTQLVQAEAQLASALAGLQEAQANLGAPGEDNVQVRAAKASLAEAELNLEWTELRAPADGYATNLVVKKGDYASAGKAMLAFVDSESFYVQGFFRETQLRHIEPGDRAVVTLMSHRNKPIEGVVESIGWAINPPNVAQTGAAGDSDLVPQVQPSFDWIRLAQRVPVRVKIESVPDGVQLISGTTASVSIRK